MAAPGKPRLQTAGTARPIVLPGNVQSIVRRALSPQAPSPLSPQIGPQPQPDSVYGREVGPAGFGTPPVLSHEPGGAVLRQFQHEQFWRTYERMTRTAPQEGWFDTGVSPSRPVQFEMNAYQVPSNAALWIFDYDFRVYRFSGADPNDAVPAEEGRFSNLMGFDININGKRFGDLEYQLEPIPVQVGMATYESPLGRATTDQFARAQFSSFAAVSGQGTSLLPVRRRVQGPENGPFTIIARPNDRVSLNTVIFRPLTTPVAWIQGGVAGYLIHQVVSEALLARLRPK